MAKDLSELVRSADWKLEKHVPAITAPAEAKAERAPTAPSRISRDRFLTG